MPSSPRARAPLSTIAAVLTALATLCLAAPALAQGGVAVSVRTVDGASADATVTLTPEGGGRAHSCRTREGACQISGVPAGTYIVTAEPAGPGRAPLPRSVPVLPSGQVRLSVTLR